MKFVSYFCGDHRFIAPEMFVPTNEFIETGPTPISKLPTFQHTPLNPNYPFSNELQKLLYGRKLLLTEVSFPIELIHDHYSNGYLSYTKGIVQEKGQYKCKRCGNVKRHLFARHECAKCNSQCVYCRHCITMGKVSECMPLLKWTGPKISYPKQIRPLNWQGQLSPGQQEASQKIVSAVGVPTKLLVWAVCGSGKTEILFEGMNKALERGQSVLISTPRSDVVHELTPRIKTVFPETNVIALYGGSEDRGKQAQLVIATTHQLLRYDNHFDFVVIDEVDAFPFSFDPMLKYAVTQASKETATTILLTATPEQSLQRQIAKREIEFVKIPKRYHGHPLPVPKLEWVGNWPKKLAKGQLPPRIDSWISNKLQTNQQAFLFVPSITLLEKLVPLLKQKFSSIERMTATIEDVPVENQKAAAVTVEDREISFIPGIIKNTLLNAGRVSALMPGFTKAMQSNTSTERSLISESPKGLQPNTEGSLNFDLIEGVHSEDKQRREKVQQFRNGNIRILVTTTILERGVTVPNVAVAVFGTDKDIFTESALVQIAGRVGRSAEFPSGEIVFFHYGKTEAMVDAVCHIETMNKLAGF